jgi:hypothetical protein
LEPFVAAAEKSHGYMVTPPTAPSPDGDGERVR